MDENVSRTEQSARYWLYWNKMVENVAQIRFQIEMVDTRSLVAAIGKFWSRIFDWCVYLNCRLFVSPGKRPQVSVPETLEIHRSSVNDNKDEPVIQRQQLTWEELQSEVGEFLTGHIKSTACRYGYQDACPTPRHGFLAKRRESRQS